MSDIKLPAETDDTVTLSRAEFERLLDAIEEAGDVAVARANQAHIAKVGWGEARRHFLTWEEAERMIAGESPVRVWREKRGLSQRALAAAARVSPSYLAEIEGGKKPGSAAALRRLAETLETTIEALLPATAGRGPAR